MKAEVTASKKVANAKRIKR